MKLKESTGRSKEKMAKTLYLYSYGGELLEIPELNIPTTRISANTGYEYAPVHLSG
jgi:hypothetical protein